MRLIHRASAVLCALLVGGSSSAGDWPQVLGPTRNGVAADDERIADGFPASGPNIAWRVAIGQGVAGVAVQDGKVLLFHRLDDSTEVGDCLNAESGEQIWRSEAFATDFRSSILPDAGPRCVPVIDGERVYAYGAGGRMNCLRLGDGSTVWSRDLFGEYAEATEEGYFGAGSSPILADGKLWVNLGAARADAGIIALSLATGETLWKGTNEQGSYSSPIAVRIDGKPRLIFLTRANLLSLNPESGDVDWRVPFGKRGPTVNGASPVVVGDAIFVTAAYGIGAKLVELKLTPPDVVWESDDVMSSQYTTPIVIDGIAYGIDGREDVGVARLRAFDPQSGDVFWTKEGFGKATLIYADGKLIAVTTKGTVKLIKPDKAEYRELASADVLRSRTLALPALSDGRLFVRDADELVCVDLRPVEDIR